MKRPDLTLLTNATFRITEVSVSEQISFEQSKMIDLAAAKLPQLIQIAEMYFDSMVGTEAEKGMVFKMVSDTLNSLRND